MVFSDDFTMYSQQVAVPNDGLVYGSYNSYQPSGTSTMNNVCRQQQPQNNTFHYYGQLPTQQSWLNYGMEGGKITDWNDKNWLQATAPPNVSVSPCTNFAFNSHNVAGYTNTQSLVSTANDRSCKYYNSVSSSPSMSPDSYGHCSPALELDKEQKAAGKAPFDWLRKQADYPSLSVSGKTRTKDKYRVVYTDNQRLELEKEFCYSKYITIKRKAELSNGLILSERQIKIWFQNRRAKERKQQKKQNMHRSSNNSSECQPSPFDTTAMGPTVEHKPTGLPLLEAVPPMMTSVPSHTPSPSFSVSSFTSDGQLYQSASPVSANHMYSGDSSNNFLVNVKMESRHSPPIASFPAAGPMQQRTHVGYQ